MTCGLLSRDALQQAGPEPRSRYVWLVECPLLPGYPPGFPELQRNSPSHHRPVRARGHLQGEKGGGGFVTKVRRAAPEWWLSLEEKGARQTQQHSFKWEGSGAPSAHPPWRQLTNPHPLEAGRRALQHCHPREHTPQTPSRPPRAEGPGRPSNLQAWVGHPRNFQANGGLERPWAGRARGSEPEAGARCTWLHWDSP